MSDLWDKLKTELDKAGKVAQEALDEGKLRIELFRVKQAADKSAQAFGYAVYRARKEGREPDQQIVAQRIKNRFRVGIREELGRPLGSEHHRHEDKREQHLHGSERRAFQTRRCRAEARPLRRVKFRQYGKTDLGLQRCAGYSAGC